MQVLSRKEYPLRNGFPSTLETLIINGCVLQRLDARILELDALTILDLSLNKLKTLPECLDGLQSLRCLNLSNNDFDCFPCCLLQGETADRIHILEMNFNKISYLPNNFVRLKNLHTLKIKDNHLVSIPHSFGNMKSVQRLELTNNMLQCLPWSFLKLKFDFLDISGNAFGEMNVGLLDEKYHKELPVPSTLFEICCRKIIQTDTKSDYLQRLPTLLKDILRSPKYCPCGMPCVNEGIPYVFSYDVSRLTHAMSYSMERDHLKILSYLCSMNCYQSYCKDPVLFQRRGFLKRK
uniref:Leucine rich repeat containing protein n=2 Tax=Clytia hemisphaerica TaxID=252671 RepID=A0A7M5V3V4_9CNID